MPSIKPDQLRQLENVRDGLHKDLKKFKDHNEMFEYVGKYLETFRTKYAVFAHSKLADIKANFGKLVKMAVITRDYMILCDDTIAAQKMTSVVNALQKTLDGFNAGKYKKVSEIREALVKIDTRVLNVKLDESIVDRLDENKDTFSKLKPVTIPSSKHAISTLEAPLMFTGYTGKSDMQKLRDGLKMKNAAGYNYIEAAKFLVVKTTGANPEEFVNKHLVAVNKNLKHPVVALHDISKELKGKYVVWCIPQIMAKYITGFMDNVDDYEIFVQ